MIIALVSQGPCLCIFDFNEITLYPKNISKNRIYICLRLINCNVAYAENSLYPIHSFNNDQLCFDKSRKDTSLFHALIEFRGFFEI